MEKLIVEHLPIAKVEANPWNPNKQNERQYAAEIESILDNGFIAPILVREHEGNYQIIDGEHRWRALQEIAEKKLEGKENVKDLIKQRTIPAVVLEIEEARAKKLTVIMNETRGQADLVSLGHLLADISLTLGDTLGVGLPYTAPQIAELMAVSDFNWDEFGTGVVDDDFDTKSDEGFRVNALLDEDTEQRWKDYLAELRSDFPKDPKLQAGAFISHLLNKAGK